MKIHYVDRLTVDLCRTNPRALHVFGDNLAHMGKAGQAVIRSEWNAFGIPTKRYPSLSEHAYFHDSNCEREHVKRHLRLLYERVRDEGFDIFWPMNGIGTGLAKMPEKSPLIYGEMCEILQKHFGITNTR